MHLRSSFTAGLGTADTTRFTDDRPLYAFTITAHRKPAAQSLKAWGDSGVAAAEPLLVRKHGIYALLLSTFRWLPPSAP